MNNDLLNISLKQGKQFNSYQTKIKQTFTTNKSKSRKEGFVSLEQNKMVTNENTTSNTNTNTNDINEITNLQSRYNELMQQYSDIQQKIGNSSLATIDRVSSNNQYLGKNLQFTDGTIVYVTYEGIAKPYTSEDILNGTIGKNGCPKEMVKLTIPWSSEYVQGAKIPTNPNLIAGSNMVMGQSCGNEGKNVYASNMINNPTSKYIGCYNDKPASTNVNVVPIMNSSNSVNGFSSGASSVWLDDPNSGFGPWAAFDQNPNTFWHSKESSTTNYNSATGMYEGSNGVNIVNMGMINGEFLQINMPGVNTSSVQNITVKQYSLSPRLELITIRSPNSWVVIGFRDGQWNQVDRQVNQSFTSASPKVYNVAFPGAYGAYILLVDRVGNNDQTNRITVQVAEWNLFMNSDDNFTNDQRAMIISDINYTNFDNCQEYAANNGYNLFGLQDVQSNGTTQCLVSNDIARTKIYGDASVQTTSIPIWSSNTATGQPHIFQLLGTGQITILDTSGKVISFINDVVGYCENWGTSLITSATYGGNCNAPIGNVSDKVAGDLKCNFVSSCSIPISNQLFGDPSPGCRKSFDIEYKCGGKSFTKNLAYAEGQTMILDCQPHINKYCHFYIILQDDGNLCVYKGKEPTGTTQELSWSSGTTGQQISNNPDWIASKGKYGRNYLKSSETLATGEWIGSTNGSLKLMMQTDGNLVLYTSESIPGCKVINDKTYGGPWVNAVYELDGVGNKATLGNIGYVDSDSNLRPYPESMVKFTNDYQIYQQTDLAGNYISNTSELDQNACQTSCNNNLDCAAYIYNTKSQACFLRNSTTGNRQQHNDGILGIRQKQPINSKNCSDKIINIDTIQYDNYKSGDKMTSDTQCRQSIISSEEQKMHDNILSQLNILGNDIVLKMEKLYNQHNNNFKELNINSEQFKKDLEKYKLTNLRIQKSINGLQNFQSNNIEGMQNLSNSLDFNDLNEMLSDSDLRVLKENYSYILWSILAVGILTITINTMKHRN